MTAPLIARNYQNHGHNQPEAELLLDYDARFLRRKILQTTDGRDVLVDLAQTTSLDHGGVLLVEGGGEVRICAAPEPLIEVRGAALHRLAWHIGNRHSPCQIEADRLLIQSNHVMKDMLTQLGAELRDVIEPFTPEGGAYGHGRTHAHEHGHTHLPGEDHAH